MKITVITARYMISGVALAQWRFARALAGRGHEVQLIVGYCDQHLSVPPIPGVIVRTLGSSKARSMVRPIFWHLKRERPDVVFSAEDHLNVLVQLAAVLAGSRARISCSSRVTPFDTYSSKWFTKRWFLKLAARALNWRADALTCVSEDMVAQYAKVFPLERRVCVYNIVNDAVSRGRLKEKAEHPWVSGAWPLVVAAGTLAPWKGFDNLIEAAAILRGRRREVRLLILGEGPERKALESQIQRLGLEDRIALPGYIENPLPFYAQAQAFALSSKVEGMPNVLIEAMMAGCTPVAANCPTGPAEILRGGEYGYLVTTNNPEAMADGIAYALDRPIPAAKLAEAVRPFEEHAVVNRHFAILGLDNHLGFRAGPTGL